MGDLFWLTDRQMERLTPFFPKSRGRARVDDRRILSGIIFVNRNGLRWRDAPVAYGPHKTLYNRWVRWSRMGVFARMLMTLAEAGQDVSKIMIDATYLKAHRTASSLHRKKGGAGRLIGLTKGGLNSKLHAVTDAKGRPIRMFLTAGQTSDYIGARALMSSLPSATTLLADRGYDAEWFRSGLLERGITPCIPARKGRKVPILHDKTLYRQRHRIENMFGRLKDWRRIATRYDRCPDIFLSACAFAAVILFWL
ncbi:MULTISPECIES: IS5 family transposase [Roseomonadaceae]|uniref:IS5 family transposase n=1 Tax=Roseomonadaceae TaxID=3385906 RepID=UPI001E5ECA32|nr:IS5 family transposase [Roseomonas oleicola]